MRPCTPLIPVFAVHAFMLACVNAPPEAPRPPPAPKPASEIRSLTMAAQWLDRSMPILLGSQTERGRLAVLHGRRARLTSDSIEWQEGDGDDLVAMSDVPLAGGGTAHVGCSSSAVFLYTDWLKPGRMLVKQSKLTCAGVVPGAVVLRVEGGQKPRLVQLAEPSEGTIPPFASAPELWGLAQGHALRAIRLQRVKPESDGDSESYALQTSSDAKTWSETKTISDGESVELSTFRPTGAGIRDGAFFLRNDAGQLALFRGNGEACCEPPPRLVPGELGILRWVAQGTAPGTMTGDPLVPHAFLRNSVVLADGAVLSFGCANGTGARCLLLRFTPERRASPVAFASLGPADDKLQTCALRATRDEVWLGCPAALYRVDPARLDRTPYSLHNGPAADLRGTPSGALGFRGPCTQGGSGHACVRGKDGRMREIRLPDEALGSAGFSPRLDGSAVFVSLFESKSAADRFMESIRGAASSAASMSPDESKPAAIRFIGGAHGAASSAEFQLAGDADARKLHGQVEEQPTGEVWFVVEDEKGFSFVSVATAGTVSKTDLVGARHAELRDGYLLVVRKDAVVVSRDGAKSFEPIDLPPGLLDEVLRELKESAASDKGPVVEVSPLGLRLARGYRIGWGSAARPPPAFRPLPKPSGSPPGPAPAAGR